MGDGGQGLATTDNDDKTHVDKTLVTGLCEFRCVSPPRSRQVANAPGCCLTILPAAAPLFRVPRKHLLLLPHWLHT